MKNSEEKLSVKLFGIWYHFLFNLPLLGSVKFTCLFFRPNRLFTMSDDQSSHVHVYPTMQFSGNSQIYEALNNVWLKWPYFLGTLVQNALWECCYHNYMKYSIDTFQYCGIVVICKHKRITQCPMEAYRNWDDCFMNWWTDLVLDPWLLYSSFHWLAPISWQ